jgi:hypothetical protein
MELAAAPSIAKAGGLIMAAIAHVFAISYVANQLDEDEDWLHELPTDMFPEDGCLWVYGVGEGGVPAFTKRRHREFASDHRRRANRRPCATKHQIRQIVSAPAVLTAWKLRTCGAHRMETFQIGPIGQPFLNGCPGRPATFTRML